jgi:hypothetical protein
MFNTTTGHFVSCWTLHRSFKWADDKLTSKSTKLRINESAKYEYFMFNIL